MTPYQFALVCLGAFLVAGIAVLATLQGDPTVILLYAAIFCIAVFAFMRSRP